MTPERLPADDDLVRYRDPETSRDALLSLGAAVWSDAVDWLYGRAAEVPTEGLRYALCEPNSFAPERRLADPGVALEHQRA